jgi:hypothetical protein
LTGDLFDPDTDPDPNADKAWMILFYEAIKPSSTAFAITAEMAGHAAFFEADRLTALRADFPFETVVSVSVRFFICMFKIPFFENPAYRVRN